jgi:MFS transporter, SP family, xylose:H+ symportor
LVSAVIFTVSALGMAASSGLSVFLIMRFSAGIGVGMASMLSPMYIAEVSPAEVRGRNVAINQLTIVSGILITNLINYTLEGKGADSWRWMFGLGAIPAILFLVGVTWLPESPRWLVMKNRVNKADRVLRKIGSHQYAVDCLYTITNSLRGKQERSFRAVFGKAIRPALIVGVTLAVFQQLCGINIVFNYTSTIFASIGADVKGQLFETVAIGVVNLIFTLVAMWQVDRLGRRPLMLFGSLGLSVLYIGLALALQDHWNAGFVSLFVFLAIGCYATSLAPVTWVLISEIFPNNVRGVASSFAIVCLWGAYFILVFTFPILAQRLGAYGPFYFYSAICMAGFLFVKARVRETKGQTLEELEQSMVAH